VVPPGEVCKVSARSKKVSPNAGFQEELDGFVGTEASGEGGVEDFTTSDCGMFADARGSGLSDAGS
jgi:hypothetical protein